jgi:hypothetical protein
MSNGEGPSVDTPSGAGSASGGLDRPGDEAADADDGATEPVPPSDDVPAAANVDAGGSPGAPAGNDDEQDEPPPAGGGQLAAGCTDNGAGCLIVNIAVSDLNAGSCIQLVLDDCERSPQAGLPVDMPVSWRLGSAFVSRDSEECLPGGAFDPRNGSAIVDASGTIAWNEDTRVPSELVLDVTLEPASTAPDTTPIRVTNSDLVEQLLECD